MTDAKGKTRAVDVIAGEHDLSALPSASKCHHDPRLSSSHRRGTTASKRHDGAFDKTVASSSSRTKTLRKKQATKPAPASARSRGKAGPPPAAEPASCPCCLSSSLIFWCQACVNIHLQRFAETCTRLLRAREDAKQQTEGRLGLVTALDGELADPFATPGQVAWDPHPSGSHHARGVRARWSHLSRLAEERKAQQIRGSAQVDDLRARLQQKQQALSHRRRTLAQAWRTLEDTKSAGGAAAVQRDIKKDIKILLERDVNLQDRLAWEGRSRQIAIHHMFAVNGPSSTASSDWTILPSVCRLTLPLPIASDIRRFPRKDINAAAALTAQLLQLQADICGVSLPFAIGLDSSGRWALRCDPLWPTSSKVGGHSGQDANKHSLHLSKTAYEYLRTPPVAPARMREYIEASVMSFGISTLATLESFVQLPGRSHQSWDRASALDEQAGKAAAGSPLSHEATTEASSGVPPTESEATTAAKSFCRSLILLAYDAAYFAWTQGLDVDLIRAGGSSLKLLHEATYSPAHSRKSHLTVHPKKSQLQDFSFPALDFAKLLQLHEAHGAVTSATPGLPTARLATQPHKETPAPDKDVNRERTSTKKAPPSAIEASYVDAGQAAASMLAGHATEQPQGTPQQRKTPSSDPKSLPTTKAVSRQAQAVSSKSAAPLGRYQARGTTPVAPLKTGGLEFLRERGARVARDSSGSVATVSTSKGSLPLTDAHKPSSRNELQTGDTVPTNAPARNRGGTVTFNGVPIGFKGAVESSDDDKGDLDATSLESKTSRRRTRRLSRRESSSAGTSRRVSGGVKGGEPAREEAEADKDDWDVI